MPCIHQCTPDNTDVPDVSESRFSAPGKRPVVIAQMFEQGETDAQSNSTGWYIGHRGVISQSHFLTLSLSYYVFIFHNVASLPFLCPLSVIHAKNTSMFSKNTDSWPQWTPASPNDELECSEKQWWKKQSSKKK